MENLIYYLIGFGILGLAYAAWKSFALLQMEEGNEHIKKVASYIKNASTAYQKTSYTLMGAFVILLAILLFLQTKSINNTTGIMVAVSFVTGVIFSALAGFWSVNITSKLPARTAKAAKESNDKAFEISFSGGLITGIVYASVSVVGLAIMFAIYKIAGNNWEINTLLNILTTYILGVSIVALFDRLVGGVFAESLQLAKKELHKSQEAIPDNTAVNPADIAKSAGVNINNASGASIDLTESFVAVLLSTMLLGASFIITDAVQSHITYGPVLLPLSIMAVGILTSITAGFFVKSVNTKSFFTSYSFAYYFANSVMAIASFFIIKYILPAEWELSKIIDGLTVITKYKSLGIFWSVFIGMAAGVILNFSTDYFTINGKPVNKLIKDTFKGNYANILSGTSKGMLATAVPVLLIFTTVTAGYYFAGLYGVGIAAVGFLANIGIVLSVNTSKAVSENADVLAKMTGMNDETILNTEEVKEFTAKKEIYVKSLSVTAAALAGFAVLSAFIQKSAILTIDFSNIWTIAFIIIGALIPFLFSASVIDAVNYVSDKAYNEIKRQFNEIPELQSALDIYKKYFGDPDVPTQGEQDIVDAAEGKAEYDDLATISTYASIRYLAIPILAIIIIPVLAGYFGGIQVLSALLTGLIPVGVILSFTQVNSGVIWKSTKNEIATGVIWNGEKYDKYSNVYTSAQTGNEIGNVYCNTSAPALNLLIKISAIIALIIAFAI